MTPPSRVLVTDLAGPDLSPAGARWLRQHPVGGVCLFARNLTTPERAARLTADLRDAVGGDLLIALDQEGGAVLRRLDVPPPPTPQALGRLGDGAAARRAGEIAARGLLDLGINWNYAPSLDVNVDPLNPVIGERAFGDDPELVARLGVAWAMGSEAAGVLSAVKHYPGHGDTRVDSHEDLPVVDKSRAALEATEWVPFRAAVAAGVGSVMTAHILYPQLDPVRPATLSSALLHDLLRAEWGYGGVVVTDALDMGAIARRVPGGRAAPLAVAAGADAALVCGHGDSDVAEVHRRALENALRDGTLTQARLEEAVARLTAATRRFPGVSRPYTPGERAADADATDTWAAAALEWRGERPRLDPRAPAVLLLPPPAALGGPYGDAPTGEHLTAALQAELPALRAAPVTDFAATRSLLAASPGAPVILATLGRWGVPPEVRGVAALLAARPAPVLHLCLWNPADAAELPLPALVTHGFRDPNLRAAARALAGA